MDQSNFVPADADPLRDRLAEQYKPLVDRTAELVAALARVPATIDETTIDKAAGFVKEQVRKCATAVGNARKTEKADYLEAGRKVDAFFGALTESLDGIAREVERRVQAFLTAKAAEERRRREEEARRAREAAEAAAAEAHRIREEEDRRAREAAEVERKRLAALTPKVDPADALAAQKAAAEAAERAEQERISREAQALVEAQRLREEAEEAERRAQAKAADMARTRGALGGTATLATSLEFEVTDKLAAIRTLAAYIDDAALDKAVRALIRVDRDEIRRQIAAEKQPVAGVRFFESYKARVA